MTKCELGTKAENVLTCGINTSFLPCITTHVIDMATHVYKRSRIQDKKAYIFKKIEFQIKCIEKTFSNILQKLVEVLKSIKTKNKQT